MIGNTLLIFQIETNGCLLKQTTFSFVCFLKVACKQTKSCEKMIIQYYSLVV